MSLIVDAVKSSRARSWLDLIPPIVTMFRDGDSLGAVETAWLCDWLAYMNREDLEPADVQTVQIPRDWAADVLGGHPESASRALRALQVSGIIAPIHGGIKGHATLYCVNPLPPVRSPAVTRDTG